MTVVVIADAQVQPGHAVSPIAAAGRLIAKEQPETIVIIGDWWDFPSISFWDKGKLLGEGTRLRNDINAGWDALAVFFAPLMALNQHQRDNKKKIYKPRVIFTEGNHEDRLYRYMRDNPSMEGMWDLQGPMEALGIEYYKFQVPVEIDGILYCHYFANPMSGKPWGGMIMNKLSKVGRSFVAGHAQILEYGERYLPTGEFQFGCVAGAFYQHDEEYKGPVGNHHFRGILKIHPAGERFDVEPICIERLMAMYPEAAFIEALEENAVVH